jgi:RNA polymerase sigma-70 factor (ECF subfamily)
MNSADFPHQEALLEHAAFVQAVARGLVRDRDRADDLAQDALVRAVQFAPRAANEIKNWLATVVRNRASDLGRSEARRSTRERAAARPEATEAVDVSCARLDAQRDVVAKILALDEPYRSVVILRYYHGLSHEQIAERLKSKPSTVRTQLSRAHAILRGKLDREYGARGAWAGLLLPGESLEPSGGSVFKLGATVVTASAAGVAVFLALRSPASSAGEAASLAVAESADSDEPEWARETAASASTQQREEVRATLAAAAPDEQLHEPAELFDRSRWRDYEKATFSFEHGVRDDLTGVVRNDWELQLERDTFDVRMVVDDSSLIVDLGKRAIETLASGELGELEALVGAAARAQREDRAGRSSQEAKVALGHTYFVWSLDTETDLASAFEVVDFVSRSHCLLDWYSTADGRTAKGSFHDLSRERSLMETLVALRAAARAPFELVDDKPRVVLQLRSGSVGGNAIKVDMGGATRRVDEVLDTPLDLSKFIDSHDPQQAYFEGGYVPLDATFVVTSARYRGQALGDSNGRGELRVVLAGDALFSSNHTPEWIDATWKGRAEIKPGEEGETYLQVSNSSQGELVLEGELVRAAVKPLPRRTVFADAKPRERRSSAGPRLIESLTARLELVEPGARRAAPVQCEPRVDVELKSGALRIRNAYYDPQALVDLGPFTPQELGAVAARGERFEEVGAAARPQLVGRRTGDIENFPGAPAVVGHAYLLSSFEPRHGSTALLFVVAHEPGVRVELDWFELCSPIATRGSLATPELSQALALAVTHLVGAARRGAELRDARAEFQFRATHFSGSKASLAGAADRSLDAVSPEPLDLESPQRDREPSLVYMDTGLIPPGQRFVITRIEYSARTLVGMNPRGSLVVRMREHRPIDLQLREETLHGEWTGELVVESGQENRLEVVADYAAAARVVLSGRFEPLESR